MLNRDSGDPTPLYYKLQMHIQREIESGHLRPGDMISPEKELAGVHNVSPGTVKKALLNLVNGGFLYRVRGKGTFIAGTSIKRESMRYYRYLKNFKSKEASLRIKFLDLKKINAVDPINQNLKIGHKESLFEIKRLFISSDKKPLIYTVSYLPQDRFKEFETISPRNFERVPLFLLLENKFGLPTISSKELLSAVSAEKDIADILKIAEGSPVLSIEMIVFTYKKRPYEYRTSYCLTRSRSICREF